MFVGSYISWNRKKIPQTSTLNRLIFGHIPHTCPNVFITVLNETFMSSGGGDQQLIIFYRPQISKPHYCLRDDEIALFYFQ